MTVHSWPMIITRRLTVKGFIVTDFVDRNEEAITKLITYVQTGKIDIASSLLVKDLSEDFESIPTTWATLFDSNKKQPGKLVTKVADPE